ncbi:class I SAM-dependent methyltransferase [Amycolatopsis thermophila]|uniref:Ubiquinone/menaquinone biosynthesis C-methylase UbiE n=1 Tax=Amycolatopsis thermophila TaxID=206084 RepID=A0ABU0F7R0_9PSEU|nr:class I SAM-dependent methyltransferase [Amycolatopsis thermophila]MDQ0383062.1 ubiquinone/menaquinone biosynthesis C-methylase UbiE [Amycolatopsis thermophila]
MALLGIKHAVTRIAGRRDHHAAAQYADPGLVRGYIAAYESGRATRYFQSRLHVVEAALRPVSGALLDVGCGPGMLVRHLLDTRPGDFRITACDRSAAMIEAVAERTEPGEVELAVARIEDMPFPEGRFDVVVAMGVLEYSAARPAVAELARVVRPGGLAVLSMLNPASPYRIVEWFLYWPLLRLLGRLERLAGVPASRRHTVPRSGIRALTAGQLRRTLRRAGFEITDVVYYDTTPLVPPLDKVLRRWRREWRGHLERTISRGARRWQGTGYLMTARRAGKRSAPALRTVSTAGAPPA